MDSNQRPARPVKRIVEDYERIPSHVDMNNGKMRRQVKFQRLDREGTINPSICSQTRLEIDSHLVPKKPLKQLHVPEE